MRRTSASVIRTADRHFTAPVEEIAGTVDSVSPGGFTLKQFPGRKFQFSSVGLSAADMAARILGEHNNLIRSEVAQEVDRRRGALRQYLTDTLSGEVRLVVPKGSAENAETIPAVVLAHGANLNQELIDQGYGQFREELGGAEAQAMYGAAGKAFGRLAEGLAFQGDSGALNPSRYLPNTFQTRDFRPYPSFGTIHNHSRRWPQWAGIPTPSAALRGMGPWLGSAVLAGSPRSCGPDRFSAGKTAPRAFLPAG